MGEGGLMSAVWLSIQTYDNYVRIQAEGGPTHCVRVATDEEAVAAALACGWTHHLATDERVILCDGWTIEVLRLWAGRNGWRWRQIESSFGRAALAKIIGEPLAPA
jgi:hypothetical protein